MSASMFSPTFIIGHIRIGSVEGASCVNLGNNIPIGFESHKKHNQGFGTVGGDHNDIPHLHSSLNDSDVLDMFNAADADIPEWIKKVVADASSEDKQ